MDSNEEAALVMTLATFTGSIKCKKRRRRKEWIKPWFQRRQHIPETFCFLISCHQFLFYFIFFFFFSILLNFAVFTPPNLNGFSTSILPEICYTLFGKFGACYLISDWLKTPVLLYFVKKSYD